MQNTGGFSFMLLPLINFRASIDKILLEFSDIHASRGRGLSALMSCFRLALTPTAGRKPAADTKYRYILAQPTQDCKCFEKIIVRTKYYPEFVFYHIPPPTVKLRRNISRPLIPYPLRFRPGCPTIGYTSTLWKGRADYAYGENIF